MASKSSKLPRAARASVDDQRMEQAERASTETFTNEMDGPERGQTTGPEAADLRAAEPLPGPGFAEHDPNQRIALSDIPRRRLDDDPLAESTNPDPNAEDELLGILESLNDTLDNATTVLAGKHALAESMSTGDAGDIGEPKKPTRSKIFTPPAMAATLGVGIGVFSLAALWPAWNSEFGQSADVTKDVSQIKETIVTKQPSEGAEVVETAAAPVIPEPATADAKPDVPALPEPPPPEQTASVSAASAAGLAPAASPVVPSDAETAIETESLTENKATTDIALPPPDEPAALDTEVSTSIEVAQNEIVTGTIPQAPPPQSLSPEEEAGFAKRGKSLIEAGDVGSARLIFTYAARRGSAAGMFALGQTYDPEYLEQWKVHGLEAEIDTALGWYMKAAKAGHKEAQGRLKTLIEARR